MNNGQLPVGITTHRMKAPRLEVWVPVVVGPVLPPQTLKLWNDDIVTQARGLIRSQGYPQNPQTEITGYYELKTNERSVLSLSQFNYAYSGGAHGLTLQKSLTFDGNTGHRAALAELFKPGANYTSRLSDIVKDQIARRNIALLVDFPGVSPNQDFYLADKSLVLYYQLYEITPYAYGFPYFPISVYEVADIVKDDGPLGRMTD